MFCFVSDTMKLVGLKIKNMALLAVCVVFKRRMNTLKKQLCMLIPVAGNTSS